MIFKFIFSILFQKPVTKDLFQTFHNSKDLFQIFYKQTMNSLNFMLTFSHVLSQVAFLRQSTVGIGGP